jgi:hypothetical protein
MNIGPENMTLLGQDMLWKVVPGTFNIMIGNSSEKKFFAIHSK